MKTYLPVELNHFCVLTFNNLVVETTPSVLKRYQAANLREKAGPKTINDEVQLLRRDKGLNLALPPSLGRAYSATKKSADAGKMPRSYARRRCAQPSSAGFEHRSPR
jgi:hypothetical protein